MDRDGFISNGELYLVLKMMVGNNLKVRGDTSYMVPDCRNDTGSRIHNYNK